MLNKAISTFHTALRYFAGSKIGFYILSPVLRHMDRFVLNWTKGRTSVTGIVAGLPIALVTVIGARSGKQRIVPLMPIPDTVDSGKLGLIAANWGKKHHPDWYLNLKANPGATCEISGEPRHYNAHEAEGEEYDHFMSIAVGMFVGYAAYAKRAGGRRIPVMVLTPVAAD